MCAAVIHNKCLHKACIGEPLGSRGRVVATGTAGFATAARSQEIPRDAGYAKRLTRTRLGSHIPRLTPRVYEGDRLSLISGHGNGFESSKPWDAAALRKPHFYPREASVLALCKKNEEPRARAVANGFCRGWNDLFLPWETTAAHGTQTTAKSGSKHIKRARTSISRRIWLKEPFDSRDGGI